MEFTTACMLIVIVLFVTLTTILFFMGTGKYKYVERFESCFATVE